MRYVHGSFGNALALALAIGTVACASGGGSAVRTSPAPSAAAGSPVSPLEGEWRLVRFEGPEGGARSVTGFLRFDRFSNITVHAELAPDDAAARPPRLVVADFTAKAVSSNGQLEYQGLRMGVDSERLMGDAVPMSEWRHIALEDDTLRLSVQAGGRPVATLVFLRAR